MAAYHWEYGFHHRWPECPEMSYIHEFWHYLHHCLIILKWQVGELTNWHAANNRSTQ